jgi:hypothetical protein
MNHSYISSLSSRLSSFLEDDDKFGITDKERDILIKDGFKPSNQLHAASIDLFTEMNPKLIKAKVKDAYSLYKSCACNQNEIAYFLLKRGIPFTAAVHYGNQTWYYERGDKFFYKLRNLGLEYEMYKDVSVGKKWDEPALEKVNVKKWLKEREKENEMNKKIGFRPLK